MLKTDTETTGAQPMTNRAYRILIVDDETPSREGLRELAYGWGYDVRSAARGDEALEIARDFPPHVFLSDLMMPGMSGLELMAQAREQYPEAVFILLTGHGTIENALQAMREGAYDYFTKPIDLDKLRVVIERALERVSDREELQRLTRDLADRGKFGRLVGRAPAMRQVYDLISQAAPSRASVLITGDSGTGKELVARTLHEMSPRRMKPFVAVNCAAIPETLLESEILGHERGAFTGATAARAGCFELANGGTLLLDEIGEMPPELQAKLLRVLEERVIRRVGGRQEFPVDVRVLSSTNIDIAQALREGRFREDLYYRLNVFTVPLPPLRDRREDVPLLAQHFIEESAKANDKPVTGMSPAAAEYLRRHDWPGNVRELRNALERAVIVARGTTLEVQDLPPLGPSTGALPDGASSVASLPGNGYASPSAPERPITGEPTGVATLPPNTALAGDPAAPVVTVRVGTTVDEMERQLIFATLRQAHENKTRAAEILGISTKTLHNKLKRYSRGTP